MRVSTNTIYEFGSSAISRQQAELLKTQQQIATGRRVATPSDDPVAADRILQVSEAQALNTQYMSNQGAASDLLVHTEAALGEAGSLLQDVRVLAVNAGNPVLSNQDRLSLVDELKSKFGQLLGLANSVDGNGGYLFSGYQTRNQPFSLTATGVSYNGDDGQRMIQVSGSRQLAVSENGADAFLRVRNGNGVFAVSAAATNGGGGLISNGQVTAPADLTGHNYQVTFSVAGGVTTYSVTDVTTGLAVNAPAAAGNPYVSGSAISFDGVQFEIQGAPANGDRFNIAPSVNQDVFATINDFVSLLQTPVSGTASQTALSNGLSSTLQNLDQAIEKVLSLRTGIGARMRELDQLASAASDAELQHQSRLSELQDTDYAKAISDLTKQQLSLDASQKSYAKITGASLFDYL